MNRKYGFTDALIPAFAMLAITPALAQGVPPEKQDLSANDTIIVTAQKRAQNIQDVPIAISALGANDLSQRGTMDTDTLSSAVPGLQITNFGSQGIAIFTIRGVSQNDFSDQNEAPNAIYVDGAYRSFIGAAGFTMFDVDRVEVLRGPQGTLYGRNATGGLVHVINKKPTRTFEAYGEVEAGERNMIEARGAVSGPLSKDVQARLSLATKHNDGYIFNTRTGKNQGGANNWTGRLQLQLAPEDSESSLLLSAHYSKDDVKGSTVYDNKRAIIDYTDPGRRIINPTSNAQYVAFCEAAFGANSPAPLNISPTSNCAGWEDPSSSPYVTEYDNPGASRRKIYGATVTANLAVSDSIDLVSISDFLKLDRQIGVDTDGTGFRMFNFSSDAKSSQLSQEVRLTGASGGINWVAGLYYLWIDHHIRSGIDALPDAYTLANANPDTLFPFKTDNSIRQTTESYAAFGQAEVPLNQQISVIGGLRWTQDRIHININPTCVNGFLPFACSVVAPAGVVQGDGFTDANSGGLNQQSKGDWSGRLQFNYRPNSDTLLYAGVTRGQKGGGFNASAIAGIKASITPFKPEILTNYEAGFKTTLFGGSTRFNGSAFYYDYKNYQAYTLTGLTPTIFNADARVIGAELELDVKPVRGLTLNGSLAYLDAIAHNVPSNLLGTGVNLGDQRMPQSPKWSANALIRYEFDMLGGTVGLQTDAKYNSRRFFNTVNHPALTDPEDFVVNARISYATSDDRWEFALWGRNLTNATVYASGFDLAGTNGSTPLAVAPPRWFGGSIRLRIK